MSAWDVAMVRAVCLMLTCCLVVGMLVVLCLLIADVDAISPSKDSYCDCVNGPDSGNGYRNTACQYKWASNSGVNVDANKLLCEDFEALTLRQDTGVGNGAPFYGPPYDNTGGNSGCPAGPDNCYRGFNSYWTNVYGNSSGAGLWKDGQPTSPSLGQTCRSTSGAAACFDGVWSVGDLWSANHSEVNLGTIGPGGVIGPGVGAMLFFPSALSDFTAEVASITAPNNVKGGGSGSQGVWDGSAVLAHRVPAGRTGDIQGGFDFPGGFQTTFGITMAMAYSPNAQSAGIFAQAWKHNEWINTLGHGNGDGLFVFHNQQGPSATLPFHHFMFANTQDHATCLTQKAAATVTVGVLHCGADDDSGAGWRYQASTSTYDQATHWPWGEWGCVRGHFENMTSTTARIRIWLTTGHTSGEKAIVDISNLNMTGQYGGVSGYKALDWNHYANTNFYDNSGGTQGTTDTVFRYEDNVHITAGAPVSCAQIGYSGAQAAVSPAQRKIDGKRGFRRRAEFEWLIPSRSQPEAVFSHEVGR